MLASGLVYGVLRRARRPAVYVLKASAARSGVCHDADPDPFAPGKTNRQADGNIILDEHCRRQLPGDHVSE